MWKQKTIFLRARSRGFHLVTTEIVEQLPELAEFSVGVASFFIKHTSASLTINENADPDVRRDMETHFNHFVPENQHYYRHVLEGSDDMPAHIKASTIGSNITVPIMDGRLGFGDWQGIYLGEHRDHGSCRQIIVTLHGE
ncbi:MAG: secondary thiamine-phosphate synthase enzyme YjbQ [Mariprofundaceae bacterium]